MPDRKNAFKKRTELHCHTKMSVMAGLYDTHDIIRDAYERGTICGLAITDVDSVQVFTDRRLCQTNHDIKIIYGVEISVVTRKKDEETSCVLIVQGNMGVDQVCYRPYLLAIGNNSSFGRTYLDSTADTPDSRYHKYGSSGVNK